MRQHVVRSTNKVNFMQRVNCDSTCKKSFRLAVQHVARQGEKKMMSSLFDYFYYSKCFLNNLINSIKNREKKTTKRQMKTKFTANKKKYEEAKETRFSS